MMQALRDTELYDKPFFISEDSFTLPQDIRGKIRGISGTVNVLFEQVHDLKEACNDYFDDMAHAQSKQASRE